MHTDISMYTHGPTHMHIQMNTYRHIHTYKGHTCTHTDTYMYVHKTHPCIHTTRAHKHGYVHAYVHVHVCMHGQSMQMYTHTHAYTTPRDTRTYTGSGPGRRGRRRWRGLDETDTKAPAEAALPRPLGSHRDCRSLKRSKPRAHVSVNRDEMRVLTVTGNLHPGHPCTAALRAPGRGANVARTMEAARV